MCEEKRCKICLIKAGNAVNNVVLWTSFPTKSREILDFLMYTRGFSKGSYRNNVTGSTYE